MIRINPPQSPFEKGGSSIVPSFIREGYPSECENPLGGF